MDATSPRRPAAKRRARKLSNYPTDLYGADGELWFYETPRGLEVVTGVMADGKQRCGLIRLKRIRSYVERALRAAKEPK